MPLTVHICSFSYHHQGIPRDEWTHGGGFVFDCRCLPNPGRRAEFAALTGRDAEVAAFLEREPEVGTFLQAVASLVGLAVESYRARRFERLTVAFGCTGGQHRSVFCAEWLRRHLVAQGVGVTLQHLSCPDSISASDAPAP